MGIAGPRAGALNPHICNILANSRFNPDTILMDYSILIVEPDVERGKEIGRLLIRSGYDALIINCADDALRRLYQAQPDAVILSNRLTTVELDHLSEAIAAMSDLPIIELTDGFSLIMIAQRLTHSAEVPELVETLDELFKATHNTTHKAHVTAIVSSTDRKESRMEF